MSSDVSQCIISVEGSKIDCQLHRGEDTLVSGLKFSLKITFSEGIRIKCLLVVKCYY